MQEPHSQLASLGAAPPPLFHDFLRGQRWPARVFRVVDGDTLHVGIVFAGVPIRLVCRLMDFDSPELRSRDLGERERAQQATRALAEAVQDCNCNVLIEFQGREKYGRMLARVFTPDGACVNDAMLRLPFNAPMRGGTRVVPATPRESVG